jgi:hypothetical protein
MDATAFISVVSFIDLHLSIMLLAQLLATRFSMMLGDGGCIL